MNQLRTSPRQRRSTESVGAILDAAEGLIHEQGQISFTAAELAERADMSVGRVYYWFPDIPAVVNALADRLQADLHERVTQLSTFTVDTPTPEVVRALVDALCDHVDVHPATVTVCFVGGATDYGVGLRSEVGATLRGIAAKRLVGVTEHELDVIAATVGGMQLGVLRLYMCASPAVQAGLRDELANMLTAWIAARFPFPDDPSWSNPHAPVRPAREHRLTRRERVSVA